MAGKVISMRISVKVKTNARENSIKEVGERQYHITVTASPVDGKANESVCRLVADFFHTPITTIAIVKGHTAKNKLIKIE